MNWKALLAVGAIAGGVAYVARQRTLKARRDAALWAEATDPIPSS